MRNPGPQGSLRVLPRWLKKSEFLKQTSPPASPPPPSPRLARPHRSDCGREGVPRQAGWRLGAGRGEKIVVSFFQRPHPHLEEWESSVFGYVSVFFFF